MGISNLFTRGSLRTRLLLAPGLSLLCFILLGFVSLEILTSSVYRDRERQLISVVETASGVLGHFQGLEASGAMSREAAQTAAASVVKAMRYAGTEYVWINDSGRPLPKMICGLCPR